MTTNFEITKIQAFPVNESKNGCVAIVRFELNNAIRFTFFIKALMFFIYF